MTTLHITLPDDLIQLLGQSDVTLNSMAREALVLRLYALGSISSGKVAELLGLSRHAALDLIGDYNLSVFDDTMGLAEEVDHAHAASRFHPQPD